MAVSDDSDPDSSPSHLEMHKEAWVGAINLPEDRAHLLRQMFKCVICRCNNHTLPHCPLMKNWVIKKKQRPDGSSSSDSESKSKTVGGVNSVLAPQDTENVITQGTPAPSLPLQTIEEEHAIDDYGTDELSDDHVDSIEFDLLDNTTCLGLMDINEQVTPYTVLNTPLGSVCSIASSQIVSASCTVNTS